MCKKKYYFLVTALIGSTLMVAGCSNKRKVDNSPLNPMATYKFSDTVNLDGVKTVELK